MATFDPATASATATARAIRSGHISARETIEAALERLDALNPALNAVVFSDPDSARDAARDADAALGRGDAVQPLHGVPTLMKDLFDFKPGWPATFGGIPALADFSVPARCTWVERIEDAGGAIVLGKTNSPVMGFRGTTDNPLFGATRNPFDPARNPGGSSGGSAAAVAAGIVPFAEATDGGGSARIPAAWCNLIGFKPSFGRIPVPQRPNAFLATDPFITEGYVTRHSEDLATILHVLSGPADADPYSWLDRYADDGAHTRGVRGMKVAYSPDFGGFPVDARVATVVDAAVAALEEAGAIVELVDTRLPRDQFELGELWCQIIAPLNAGGLATLKGAGFDLLADHRDELPGPFVRWVEAALTMTLPEFGELQAIRTEVYDFVTSFFADHDLLVTPTLACPPVLNADEPGSTTGPSEVNGVPVDPYIGWCLTYPLNYTGHPAASVPAGLDVDGLPVGLQVVGRRGEDSAVIAACGALEQVRPWGQHYPAKSAMGTAHRRSPSG